VVGISSDESCASIVDKLLTGVGSGQRVQGRSGKGALFCYGDVVGVFGFPHELVDEEIEQSGVPLEMSREGHWNQAAIEPPLLPPRRARRSARIFRT
jgi:hypothetical protein